MSALADWCATIGLRALARAVRFAPRVAERAVTACCDVAWLAMRGRRNVVRDNLLPFCDGDEARAHRLSRQVFRNVGRYYVDLVHMSSADPDRFAGDIRIGPPEHIPAVTDPGPVIIVSAHWGTPEVSVQACLAHGRPFLAMAERLAGERLREEMRRLRQSHGGIFVDADYRGLREALGWLRRGGVVAFVADRDIAGNGPCVEFGGRRVRIADGPWQLAQRTGARIVPVFAPRRGRFQYVAEFGEPFTVARDSGDSGIIEAAQRFARETEAHIRRAPGQWTVLEPFWERHDCGQG